MNGSSRRYRLQRACGSTLKHAWVPRSHVLNRAAPPAMHAGAGCSRRHTRAGRNRIARWRTEGRARQPNRLAGRAAWACPRCGRPNHDRPSTLRAANPARGATHPAPTWEPDATSRYFLGLQPAPSPGPGRPMAPPAVLPRRCVVDFHRATISRSRPGAMADGVVSRRRSRVSYRGMTAPGVFEVGADIPGVWRDQLRCPEPLPDDDATTVQHVPGRHRGLIAR